MAKSMLIRHHFDFLEEAHFCGHGMGYRGCEERQARQIISFFKTHGARMGRSGPEDLVSRSATFRAQAH